MSEAITGANAGTAKGIKAFKYIQSIKPTDGKRGNGKQRSVCGSSLIG
jgi:hypothetical protein